MVSETSSVIPTTASVHIKNEIPSQQALILQNTNKDLPIQIRVDPVTDYTALWVTLSVSILVSSITAFVTIWLVTRSNRELSSNQLDLQEQMLSQQEVFKKNEVKAQNRQAWINHVRQIFVNYFSHTHKLSFVMQEYFSVLIAYERNIITDDTYNIHIKEYFEYIQILETLKVEIDITLSAKDKLDRRISHLVDLYCQASGELHNHILNRAKHPESQTLKGEISINDIHDTSYFQNMMKLNTRISRLIKLLLKKEWEKVKSFE